VVAKFWSEHIAKGQVVAVHDDSSNIHVTRATVSNAEKASFLKSTLCLASSCTRARTSENLCSRQGFLESTLYSDFI
jgi:hypothetical protein